MSNFIKWTKIKVIRIGPSLVKKKHWRKLARWMKGVVETVNREELRCAVFRWRHLSAPPRESPHPLFSLIFRTKIRYRILTLFLLLSVWVAFSPGICVHRTKARMKLGPRVILDCGTDLMEVHVSRNPHKNPCFLSRTKQKEENNIMYKQKNLLLCYLYSFVLWTHI